MSPGSAFFSQGALPGVAELFMRPSRAPTNAFFHDPFGTASFWIQQVLCPTYQLPSQPPLANRTKSLGLAKSARKTGRGPALSAPRRESDSAAAKERTKKRTDTLRFLL